MPNVFKTKEQRQHWNEYNNQYSKKNYKTITFKLNKRTDKDVIDYFERIGGTPSDAVRQLVRGKCLVKNSEKELDAQKEKKMGVHMTEKVYQTNNIRHLRIEHNVTQTELAEKLGVTKQALSLSENGHVTRKTAKKIADYFNVSILEVMGLDAFEYKPETEDERQYLIALLNQLKL